MISIPPDLDSVINDAWNSTKNVPGYLLENEARFLGVLAALVPGEGQIVEIGSYLGRSTVMLAKVAARYKRAPVVAIDPHNSPILLKPSSKNQPSSYDDFLKNLRNAGVEKYVEPHLAYSKQISEQWNRPIRLLWIDGDHSYEGAKADIDGFLPFLSEFGVVALHDTLSPFPGPIRIFVDEILKSPRFGPAGFVHSVAWAQLRPTDAKLFEGQRARLTKKAARLIPLVPDTGELHGLRKIRYKLSRSRVPRFPLPYSDWAKQLDPAARG